MSTTARVLSKEATQEIGENLALLIAVDKAGNPVAFVPNGARPEPTPRNEVNVPENSPAFEITVNQRGTAQAAASAGRRWCLIGGIWVPC